MDRQTFLLKLRDFALQHDCCAEIVKDRLRVTVPVMYVKTGEVHDESYYCGTLASLKTILGY